MSWYRLYFLSTAGDIRNADAFESSTDSNARLAAGQIHEAVSDLYAGYELWVGTRRVCAHDRLSTRRLTSAELEAAQAYSFLLHRLEILLDSETAFARSARLADRVRELRKAARAMSR